MELNQILYGDALDGRFIKGVSVSPDTQFKPGQHWREPKPFWEKEWLDNEYTIKKRDVSDIAADYAVTIKAIYFWLSKHGIKTRDTSEIRKNKHWGSLGTKNPMFGKTGSKNANWKGGITPERQAFYASQEWKEVVPIVFKKYAYLCDNCDSGHTHNNALHIHHLVSFGVKELRMNLNNLVLLCKTCHNFVHSKRNINKNYILTHEQFKNKFE